MRSVSFLAVAALVVLAGCTGSGVEPAATSSPGQTSHTDSPLSTPGRSSTATPALASDVAGDRAIAAEKARIRNETEAWDHLADLSFGILRPAEYEIQRRNASGVVVRTTVGYSVTFDCNESLDGATTRAQYLVTADETRLLSVEQDLLDPSYCS